MFATISETSLESVTGGTGLIKSREPQRDVNGAIVGGNRILRQSQTDSNGAIVGGERLVRFPQTDVNGAIVGGDRV